MNFFYVIGIMLPTGIGVDIEDVSRFSSKKYEQKKSFYTKIFTNQEIDYCLKKRNPYPHFTARFCAKEAAIKALNNKKIRLSDIEIIVKNNRPILNLPKGRKGFVSLSHTEKYAIAFVML